MSSSFPWLMAMRYLRLQVARSLKLHYVLPALVIASRPLGARSATSSTIRTGSLMQDFRLEHPALLRMVKIGCWGSPSSS